METLFEWLPRVGAIFMLGIGGVGLLKPTMLLDQLGFKLEKPLASSESRAVFGGINLGGALTALYLHDPNVYTALGVGWAFATGARFVSMGVDGTSFQDSIPTIIFDGLLALLLLSVLL